MCDMDLPNNDYAVVAEESTQSTSKETLEKCQDFVDAAVNLIDCTAKAYVKKKEKEEYNVNPIYTTEVID